MQIACYEEWHTSALLGIRLWNNTNIPDSSSSEQSEWCHNYLVCPQEVTWVSTRPWIRPGKGATGSRRETVWRTGVSGVKAVQPVVPKQESGSNAPAQCQGPVWKGSHKCSRAFPTEQPKKHLLLDCCGLFYQVAGSLRHSKSRGFDSGRWANN